MFSFKAFRGAIIGFIASVVSDIATNAFRVVKTLKQALPMEKITLSYLEAVRLVIKQDGIQGLLGRGLTTRILSNGLQSMLFTIVWKAVEKKLR